jgi:hypothetical protein
MSAFKLHNKVQKSTYALGIAAEKTKLARIILGSTWGTNYISFGS